MGYAAEVILDSISPQGVRLTTMTLRFPRILLAEVNTHRKLSRSSESSRAIPVSRRIQRVIDEPFIPEAFSKNKRGMSADTDVDEATNALCTAAWLRARDAAVAAAQDLVDSGVHKQHANRLLEPFTWHTAIVSSTSWDNFWGRRALTTKAQPEMIRIARMAYVAYKHSTPTHRGRGEWHLPYVTGYESMDDLEIEDWVKVSVGRCARVSYLTHDGRRAPSEDMRLCDDLLADGHMSPFEHVAQADSRFAHAFGTGNFDGDWVQFRKMILNEQNIPAELDESEIDWVKYLQPVE